MITILSDDTYQKAGQAICNLFTKKGIDTSYIPAANVNVMPCYGCGSCTDKSFGKCIIRDDADKFCATIIQSETMILVTPVTWGGYSYKVKKVLDKCSLIGDRTYRISRGELVKGMQGNLKSFYVIGIKDNCSEQESKVFHGLAAENINIMNLKGNSFLLGNNFKDNDIADIVEEIANEHHNN
jgi:hypothetical protein